MISSTVRRRCGSGTRPSHWRSIGRRASRSVHVALSASQLTPGYNSYSIRSVLPDFFLNQKPPAHAKKSPNSCHQLSQSQSRNVNIYSTSPVDPLNALAALVPCEQNCLQQAPKKQLRWSSKGGHNPEDCSRRTDQQ